MKKELVIVSDLWGVRKSDWLDSFKSHLSTNYTISFLDACSLGELDIGEYKEKNLHHQFIEFGIEKAVAKLLAFQNKSSLFIGCSVGGVILWKAALSGLPIDKLITISSTRLRKETASPKCDFQLYFGKNDPYKPSTEWLNQIGRGQCNLLKGGHEIYKNEASINQIIEDLSRKEWIK